MKIAVIIPCFKVKNQILSVVESIGPEVEKIYVVDDFCPHQTGKHIEATVHDSRVNVLYHSQNQGVGGAVCTGYKAAFEENMDIMVKIDGDGQMDTRLISKFTKPIMDGRADYTKGSRFYSLKSLQDMPGVRKFGNAVLSFVNKASSGYWNLMDPTNGYTAIHRKAYSMLPIEKLSKRYFFESDMLFRLGTLKAVVEDIPMDAIYEDEESSLNIKQVIVEFPPLYLKAFFKRIFYNYFLRDFNGASMELILGAVLMFFGGAFGIFRWAVSILSGAPATTGTVMFSALPIILGFQLLLNAATVDMNNLPSKPLSRLE